MNDTTQAIRHLTLLFVLAASQTGCADSIELFPNDDVVDASDGGGDRVDAESQGDVAANHADAGPDAPAEPEDAGAPLDAGTCTLRPGGRVLSSCRRAYQSCAISGPAFAEATFIGCSDERGVGGNPDVTVATCESALLGESGRTCRADLKCTGPATDTCCVRHAECGRDMGLVLAEICVPNCERTPLLAGPTVRDCDELAAVDAAPESAYGSLSKLPNLVGLPCAGEFECGPESSYGFSVFCGAGRLQLLTLGPSGFGSL